MLTGGWRTKPRMRRRSGWPPNMRLGDTHPGRQGETQSRGSVQGRPISWTCTTWFPLKRSKPQDWLQLQFTSDHWRHREGFQLTDPRHRSCWRAGPDSLLHQVPQPGERQLLDRPPREGRNLQSKRFRGEAGGLPARREDLRDEHREGKRQPGGGAGGGHGRQSDGAATGHRICNDCMKSCISRSRNLLTFLKLKRAPLKMYLELALGL